MKDGSTPATDFCIICGDNFDDNTVPSKEHIIPEALGNEKLVTYCVCEKCNNELGSNVDSYLTDYILVKMLRKEKLEKDKDLQIFDSDLTDDKGDKYRIRNDGPEVFPKIDVDKQNAHVHMEVATVEEGIKEARRILKKKFKLEDEQIDEIINDPERFIKGETQYIKPGIFKQDAMMDQARFRLAVIKIAYEYAVEKLGASYTSDPDAAVLRAYLKAGRDGKKDFNDKEYKDISERCHPSDSFTEIMTKACGKIPDELISYTIWLVNNIGNQLVCGIRILNSNFLTFSVFLSKDARKYMGSGRTIITIITGDGQIIEA
ncbi:MAG: HNH endonuclease [Lachnospiraceae bacterium]|nr:HNH endonuclease [Lachnospiraceae bacterium]